MIPRLSGTWGRHVTDLSFFGLAVYAAVYGISYAYMLHHIVNGVCAWLVAVHVWGNGGVDFKGVRDVLEGGASEEGDVKEAAVRNVPREWAGINGRSFERASWLGCISGITIKGMGGGARGYLADEKGRLRWPPVGICSCIYFGGVDMYGNVLSEGRRTSSICSLQPHLVNWAALIQCSRLQDFVRLGTWVHFVGISIRVGGLEAGRKSNRQTEYIRKRMVCIGNVVSLYI